MLIQKNRFHGHGSLRYVYRNGETIRSSVLTIKYIENPRRKNSRFSVVVGKKVMKSAVRRNRIRRRIYEVIRKEIPKLRDNRDVVLMVFSSEVLTMDSQALYDMIKQFFSQANLYK